MTKTIKAKVYHHAFGDGGECVAVVEFEPGWRLLSPQTLLDIAYRDTNTIHQAWWENFGIEMVGPAKEAGGCRSTSVGDVIVLEKDDGSSQAYKVENFGFSLVSHGGL
jgi:hypothetical protein